MFDWLFGRKKPENERASSRPASFELATDQDPTVLCAEQLLVTSVRDTPAVLETLRAEESESGLIPVILGSAEDLASHKETIGMVLEDGITREQMMQKAEAFDVEKWLRESAAQHDEDSKEDPEILSFVGRWPSVAPARTGLIAHEGAKNDRVYVGRYRADESWRVLVSLLWSAFNYDIGPEIHGAVHRRWAKLYGSEVICATGDVIQCRVVRPPATKDEAMKLAWEQFHYCPDIVSQGIGSISGLAATLMNAEIWYFWWD